MVKSSKYNFVCFTRIAPWRVEARVEKRVEEEKEVARYLLANMQKPGIESYFFRHDIFDQVKSLLKSVFLATMSLIWNVLLTFFKHPLFAGTFICFQ